MKYDCPNLTCKSRGFVNIDHDNGMDVCDIKGFYGAEKVHICQGEVNCAECKTLIYKSN